MAEELQHISKEDFEYLQKKYDQLFNAVSRTRKFQIDWDMWHASGDKERKRHWERQLDAIIAKEAIERKKQQKTIFNKS